MEKELPCITIAKRKFNPNHICVDESYVQVKSNNVKSCEKIARRILKEDLE